MFWQQKTTPSTGEIGVAVVTSSQGYAITLGRRHGEHFAPQFLLDGRSKDFNRSHCRITTLPITKYHKNYQGEQLRHTKINTRPFIATTGRPGPMSLICPGDVFQLRYETLSMTLSCICQVTAITA